MKHTFNITLPRELSSQLSALSELSTIPEEELLMSILRSHLGKLSGKKGTRRRRGRRKDCPQCGKLFWPQGLARHIPACTGTKPVPEEGAADAEE
jgi:hypothetical protein